ncbi:cysteine protease StiP domain-containing protein [Deinococcus yavapaiensis]|uniref:RNA binding Pelota-like protein n=1 Tax=Deinococcus yavapaiensis KR-236 TaxID=694435 RepID=A0A318S2W0_9DEIO|nr:cysteine protease StiP domain-containing protein [Deinococcus yavapaiensis]PYE49998.1 RNA binding Pelota-like protein [Deinococcus yavapaiensis KR-236]
MIDSLSDLLTSTFHASDVTVLLRPGTVELVGVAEKEVLLRSGRSYATLLTPEEAPSDVQVSAYEQALSRNAERLGELLSSLSSTLLERYPDVVYVSLARAGTPIGCVLRRLARAKGREVAHYTLSIIRGEGLDLAALRLVRERHPTAHLVFIDGWSGKGAIARTLRASMPKDERWSLALVSDPAGVADHPATFADLLLPHALLNATVSGLLSRSFTTLPGKLHGARLEVALAPHDLSRAYIDTLEHVAVQARVAVSAIDEQRPLSAPGLVLEIARSLGVRDVNLVKPGVGEATRVFLRREPGHLLLKNKDHLDTLHLVKLAERRSVPITVRPDLPYLAAAFVQAGSGA